MKLIDLPAGLRISVVNWQTGNEDITRAITTVRQAMDGHLHRP